MDEQSRESKEKEVMGEGIGVLNGNQTQYGHCNSTSILLYLALPRVVNCLDHCHFYRSLIT